MNIDYDVIVGGGSIVGLLAARQIAAAGVSVLVLEDHPEIGIPEKCDGLVGSSALEALGIMPKVSIIQNYINGAILHSPSGKVIEIDASNMGILVVDRSKLDLDVAQAAVRNGAEIRTANPVEQVQDTHSMVRVSCKSGDLYCRFFLDAMGSNSLMVRGQKEGIFQAAKYVIAGDWFQKDRVELFFDNNQTPGFFTWIIPTSERTAKVGAAGKGINSFRTLDRFVHEKGGSILKRVAAPIIVSGPIKNFINGRIIKAGDAARQTKPSTAGGIYSGGIGGILAGDSIAKAVRTGNPRTLEEYEKKWRRIFGREFSSTLRARAVFETLRNKHLTRILDELASSQNTLNLLSSHGDFDFHSAALLKAIGTGTVIKILKTVAAAELSRLRPFARSQS